LRQKAEENRLRFQSLSLAGQKDNFALLWAERPSPMEAAPERFNGQFLGISNPFTNASCGPDGYVQTWQLDSQGNRVMEDEPGARAATMTPLALYALDHPRVPLLLVDFCNPHRPGAGERCADSRPIHGQRPSLTSLSSWRTCSRSPLTFVRGGMGRH
jgi:hypothetical protein